MAFSTLSCPVCNSPVKQYLNPLPAVDIIIETKQGIVLIERKNEPFGWALPGGFVDYGESLESAAAREALEETSLVITNLRLLGCYSDPQRDSRMHTISTVFIASAKGTPKAADDAINLQIFSLDMLPQKLCFDHSRIISDYSALKLVGQQN